MPNPRDHYVTLAKCISFEGALRAIVTARTLNEAQREAWAALRVFESATEPLPSPERVEDLPAALRREGGL